jgi:hypothetical protein
MADIEKEKALLRYTYCKEKRKQVKAQFPEGDMLECVEYWAQKEAQAYLVCLSVDPNIFKEDVAC